MQIVRSIMLLPMLSVLAGASSPRRESEPRMPTAQLPFEPFSPDEEVLDAPLAPKSAEKTELTKSKVALPSLDYSAIGLYTQVALKPKGFTGVFRAVEYPLPWLGFQQSLRYQDNQDASLQFAYRSSLGLGVELHPWRQRLISPFASFELGGERLQKREDQDPLELFRLGAAAGLELRMGRYASLVGQWSSAYYPDLKQPILADETKVHRQQEMLEVFFNINWETRY